MPDDIENGLSTNMLEPARLEQTFLTKMQEPAILIYQLLPDKELADRRFMAMEYLQGKGLPVERTSYEPIYALTVSTAEMRPEQLLPNTGKKTGATFSTSLTALFWKGMMSTTWGRRSARRPA